MEILVSTTNANMTTKLDVKTNEIIELEKNLYIKYYDETIIGKLSLPFFLNIWKDIKSADVVHVQAMFNTPIPISLFFAWLFKKPTVLSPRGSLGKWVLGQGNKFKKLWLTILIRPFCHYVVWHATADQEKEEILSHFPMAKVKVIPNGIYIDEFQTSNSLTQKEYLQKYIGIDVKDINKIIISMGRLQKKKGFDILIDSFFKVLKLYPSSYLIIAGPNEGEKKKLIKQINKLDLVNNVFLIGNIGGQDKIDFLANADLFVLPSYNENFGNVYVESLATGTPIVASTNTPWAEVEHFKCGKWVDNNKDDTTCAISEMLEKDREVMRVNSKRFAEKYDWKKIAVEFKDLFDGILSKKGNIK